MKNWKKYWTDDGIDYKEFLEGMIDGSEYYSGLFDLLFEREFYSPVDLDQNRATYGLLLRSRYEEVCGIASGTLDELGPCTVLEMLIALAEQIDTSGVGAMSDQEKRSKFFWEMIQNLGIYYSDYVFDSEIRADCEHKIDILLDRKYAANGTGGLFPLQNCSNDQRKIELWYQMQAYYIEKSGI